MLKKKVHKVWGIIRVTLQMSLHQRRTILVIEEFIHHGWRRILNKGELGNLSGLSIRPGNSYLCVVFVFFPCHVVYFFRVNSCFGVFWKLTHFSCNSCNFKIFVSPCRVHFFIRFVSCFLPCFSYFFVSCQIRIHVVFVSCHRVVSRIARSKKREENLSFGLGFLCHSIACLTDLSG